MSIVSKCQDCGVENPQAINHSRFQNISICSICGHPISWADIAKLQSHRRMPTIILIIFVLMSVALFFTLGLIFSIIGVVTGVVFALITKNILTGRVIDLSINEVYFRQLMRKFSTQPSQTNIPLPTEEEFESYVKRLEQDVKNKERGEFVVQSQEKSLENDKIKIYIMRHFGEGVEAILKYPERIKILTQWIIDTDDRYLSQREWSKASKEYLVQLNRNVFTFKEFEKITYARDNNLIDEYRSWTEVGSKREDGWAIIKTGQKELMRKFGLSAEDAEVRARELYLSNPNPELED